jgi:hypothetical protein
MYYFSGAMARSPSHSQTPLQRSDILMAERPQWRNPRAAGGGPSAGPSLRELFRMAAGVSRNRNDLA